MEEAVMDNDYYEYLIIISPPEEIKQYARECNTMANSVLRNEMLNPPSDAHLTLVYYKDTAEKDEIFLKAVKRVSKVLPGFHIQLNGFGYFKSGRKSNILYISILNEDVPSKVHYALRKELNLRAEKFIPHITVKRNVGNAILPVVIKQLEKIQSGKDFFCDKIVLLKRKVRGGKKKNKYETLLEAPLVS